jgi:uncharacterized lipoprotein YddW (UPF0748 family)
MRLSQSMYLSVRMIVVIAVIAGSGCAIERNQPRADRTVDATLADSVFGLWVTRWDYQTQSDIRTIVADAASMGITDLYWQVRGQGDAYYRSDLEPWGEELTRPRGEEGKSARSRDRTLDPGFDPLALAIDKAHRQGVRVHAWINVMPLWRGKTPPIDQSHPFYTHPEWRLTDETGKPQPLGDGYVVVNPVLDSVQDHIVAVAGDIADRYNIDGIHLDYIRFLTDELGKEKLYPGDAQSLSLYARMVGDRATIGQLNRTKYRAWIRDRITTLVKRIGRESLDGHTEIRYSAAVWRRPDLAKDQYLQDAQRWVNEGMVDEIMPMIYTEKDTQFEDDLEAWYSAVDRKRVLAGIGVYKHPSAGQTLSQATLGHPRRFVLFAYSSIFESTNPDQDKTPDAVRLRAMERDALIQFIRRIGG